MFVWQPLSEVPFLATRGKLPSNSSKKFFLFFCFLFSSSLNKSPPWFSQVFGQCTNQNPSLTTHLMTMCNQIKDPFSKSQKQRTIIANCYLCPSRGKRKPIICLEKVERDHKAKTEAVKVQSYSFTICHNHCHSPKAIFKSETRERVQELEKK